MWSKTEMHIVGQNGKYKVAVIKSAYDGKSLTTSQTDEEFDSYDKVQAFAKEKFL